MTARENAVAMFESADKLDVDGWVEYLADDVYFRFGNADPIRGRDGVRSAVTEFFGMISGLHHEVIRDWESNGTVVQQIDMTYIRHDGNEVKVPATNILDFRDGKIAEYRIYVDLAPLWT